jgi:hypothetical protein
MQSTQKMHKKSTNPQYELENGLRISHLSECKVHSYNQGAASDESGVTLARRKWDADVHAFIFIASTQHSIPAMERKRRRRRTLTSALATSAMRAAAALVVGRTVQSASRALFIQREVQQLEALSPNWIRAQRHEQSRAFGPSGRSFSKMAVAIVS